MNDFSAVHRLWDFRSTGTIWKLLPAEEHLIVGEERDASTKALSFFCVALDDGRVRWRRPSPSGSWWSGIETVHDGVVFIHEYPVPSMPDHRNIFAVDLLTGNSLWENTELSFALASGSSVFAAKELFDRKEFFELELRTGTVVRTVSAGELKNRFDGLDAGWRMDIDLPVAAAPPPEAVLSAFPPTAELEGGESLSHAGMDVWSWYEVLPAEGPSRRLREHLFVLDAHSGSLLYRDVVCDGLAFPTGSTFFRMQERILYVKDRTTLCSFSLSSGRGGNA